MSILSAETIGRDVFWYFLIFSDIFWYLKSQRYIQCVLYVYRDICNVYVYEYYTYMYSFYCKKVFVIYCLQHKWIYKIVFWLLSGSLWFFVFFFYYLKSSTCYGCAVKHLAARSQVPQGVGCLLISTVNTTKLLREHSHKSHHVTVTLSHCLKIKN